MIELKNTGLIKKEKPILKNISFNVQEGDIIGVAGPSGAGKTSLFRLLNLLDSYTTGEIQYRGKALLSYEPLSLRREIGYVFQKPYLFGRTVRDNLYYPYYLIRQSPDEGEIENYLNKVNLSFGVLDKKNTELSGGEQQRIALVRSLLIKPQILLLDEVTASLDEENTKVVEHLVINEQKARGLTVLFISHNLEQARRMAKKMIGLVRGELKFYGPTEEFLRQKEVLLNE